MPDPETSAAFFERHHTRHVDRIFRLCLRMWGGEVAAAEDATQEVFVRFWEKEANLREHPAIGQWLSTVAYRLCLDRLRRERAIWPRVRAALDRLSPDEEPRATPVLLRIESKRILEAITALSPNERAVFVMVHQDGHSQKEVSEILGFSKGYVSKLLARATQRVTSKWGGT